MEEFPRGDLLRMGSSVIVLESKLASEDWASEGLDGEGGKEVSFTFSSCGVRSVRGTGVGRDGVREGETGVVVGRFGERVL